MNGNNRPQTGMQLYDAEGRRLYFTEDERRAFVAAAAQAPREVRTFCGVLHATGCRISETLALTAQQIDLSGRVVVFESLKKRRRGVYRAVPVPPELLDALDLVHDIREAQRRGQAKALLWPWSLVPQSGVGVLERPRRQRSLHQWNARQLRRFGGSDKRGWISCRQANLANFGGLFGTALLPMRFPIASGNRYLTLRSLNV